MESDRLIDVIYVTKEWDDRSVWFIIQPRVISEYYPIACYAMLYSFSVYALCPIRLAPLSEYCGLLSSSMAGMNNSQNQTPVCVDVP